MADSFNLARLGAGRTSVPGKTTPCIDAATPLDPKAGDEIA
jgi:hypothetical protein